MHQRLLLLLPTAVARLVLAGLVLTLWPCSAYAQRELHWDRLGVTAQLEADGSLTVVEEHTMVFTGDWNGGERVFNIRPRQGLTFIGIYRQDAGGQWRELQRDSSLDDVDEYAWSDDRTLRWRSRRASDPPFAATVLRYEIRYTLTSILLKEEDGYRLDHDFAFPDRVGPINQFELQLAFDAAWAPLSDVRSSYTAGPLVPGRSFVLDIPLRYTGAGLPTALDLSRSREIVYGVSAIVGVTLLAIIWLFQREWSYGRFAPLERRIDDSWLRAHVLQYPAEVVAAAWDENVGSAEVVALIARMVEDGTLESSISKGKDKTDSMSLRLKVDRRTLQGHERVLVDKLFFGGRSDTSTKQVREHYRSKGFNPATEIEKELRAAVDRVLPGGRVRQPFGVIPLMLFLVGLGLVLWNWFQGYPGGFVLVAVIVVLCGVGRIAGWQFRSYVEWGPRAALLCLLPPIAAAAGAVWYLWFYVGSGAIELQPQTVVGLTAIALAGILWAIVGLKTQRTREALAFRKALTAARAYFVAELGKAQPALRDEWYPWLLAFELGKQVDTWTTERVSPEVRSRTSSSDWSSSSSSSSSSTGSGWTGFTGGRSGGAGAGASWQAAAGGMAASISPPSSSGSSGSSGGGSSGGSSSGGSSGGGGGGGW